MKNQLSSLPDQKRSGIFVLLILALFLQACKSTSPDPITPYDYFPLEIGRYRIFEVTEDVYSAGTAKPVRKTWQEKDEIIGMNEDTTNGKIFLFSRSIRNTSADSWKKIKEYTAQKYIEKVVVNIDNEVLMPLIFPYSPQARWDGYRYFMLPEDDVREGFLHTYRDINQPLDINGLHFDKTLKVSERDEDGLVQLRLGYKQYAVGVGLITDEQTDFYYSQEGDWLDKPKEIASGVSRVKKIIEFGVTE
ncbi:hypothetical protein [Dyadobacter sp. CY312]|uniref:hypothetical protein n=1 Tax=Dyadobacter sp. CY312 TaxID=2907303 RepID=UPI001F2A9A40|nr:hypothetical protein [Dyadobacter sp. CY312]MCE7040621.1 hypothetical protein [Dyadobacter sp. CY312]